MRDKGGYWYKNETLIDRLGITSKEEKHMKTIIGIDEKYFRSNEKRRAKRRNEKGLTKREQDKLKLIELIQSLKKEGYTQKDISKKIDKSLRTINRY